MARAPRWAPPLLALQFLTRLPVPVLARLSGEQAADGMARAMAWLPPVGTLVGAATAGVILVAGEAWPPLVAVLLALGLEALLTGAFHEDAVADFCDAFGGTARGETALRIMRDSRIGTYGTMGLGLSVALRAGAIVALPPALMLPAIMAAATLARLCAVILAAILPPAQADGAAARMVSGMPPGRMGSGMPPGRIALALALALPGLLPLAILHPHALLAALAASALLLGWLTRFLRARIGGSTGDCLGFAAYMAQLALLLAAAAT